MKNIPIKVRSWEAIKGKYYEYVGVSLFSEENGKQKEEFLGFTLGSNMYKKYIIKIVKDDSKNQIKSELRFYNFIVKKEEKEEEEGNEQKYCLSSLLGTRVILEQNLA